MIESESSVSLTSHLMPQEELENVGKQAHSACLEFVFRCFYFIELKMELYFEGVQCAHEED